MPRLTLGQLAVKMDMRFYVFLVELEYYSNPSFSRLNLMKIFKNCFFLMTFEALNFIKIDLLFLDEVF